MRSMGRTRRRRNRKNVLDYILPFLILVSIGIIGTIGFQIWSTWSQQGKANVYFYVAEGTAKILPYGETDWTNAYSGTKLLLGDAIKTSGFGRTVLDFFNGTKVRMGKDTAVTLADLVKASDHELILLHLENGMIWLNGHKSDGVKEARYEVRTSHMHVKATGTVFEVESNSVEVVRVFDGEVSVDVLVGTGGNERVAETVEVGVGQELILDEAALRAFEDGRSPSVLTAVSDDFKAGSWYRWNTNEDANPTDFSVTGGSESSSSSSLDDDSSLNDDDEMLGDDESDDEADLANNEFGSTTGEVEFTSPDFTTTSNGTFVIAGTVPAGTTKVEVESPTGGSYVLSKFSEGDTTFSYNVSEAIGNVRSGSNTYKVYTYDEDGEKGEASTITITLDDGSDPESDDAEDDEPVEVSGTLAAPKVLTFNGGSSSTVTSDTVTIGGSIQGAAKVVVSGYTLTAFSPGDTSWSYTAKESLGNLSPGENTFHVYGIDGEGKRSETVTFTVTYNKPEGSSSNEEASNEEEPANTSEEEEEPVEEESNTPAVPDGF